MDTTIRVPKELRDLLKVIASVEKKDIKEIVSDLISDYIQRHKETLELLSTPAWVKIISKGKKEVKGHVKGKSLSELED